MIDRDALVVRLHAMYDEGEISADAAGEILHAIGVPRLKAHAMEANIDTENQDREWTDEKGRTWALDIQNYRDHAGRIWRWAGGWTWLDDAPGDKQPIMYRTDRPKDETALCRVLAVVGELTP